MRVVVVVHAARTALARRPATVDCPVQALFARLGVRPVEVVCLADRRVVAGRQDGRG